MPSGEQAEEALKQHLRQAIDRLHADIDAVEFWTEALRSFSQPIPDYEPDKVRLPTIGRGSRPDQRFDYTRIGMRT
jgi:hypothetical protein